MFVETSARKPSQTKKLNFNQPLALNCIYSSEVVTYLSLGVKCKDPFIVHMNARTVLIFPPKTGVYIFATSIPARTTQAYMAQTYVYSPTAPTFRSRAVIQEVVVPL